MIGKDKLTRLKESCACVIGLGAVGSYALEGLARAGVGRLIVADFDIIRPANINRQLLATENTLGLPKTLAARERVLSINPEAQVETIDAFVDSKVIKSLIELKPDVIIDAIDSLSPKIQVLSAVYRSGIPIISSMGAATRTDPAMVKVADLLDTRVCPLAARIRRRLKDEGVGRGITCIYSEQFQNVHALSSDAEKEEGELERGRRRRRLGSLSTITGIFGLFAATMALDKLTGGLNQA